MKFYRYIVTDQNREIKENSLLLIMIYQTFKKSSEKKNPHHVSLVSNEVNIQGTCNLILTDGHAVVEGLADTLGACETDGAADTDGAAEMLGRSET